jgi:hypothetical protein
VLSLSGKNVASRTMAFLPPKESPSRFTPTQGIATHFLFEVNHTHRV